MAIGAVNTISFERIESARSEVTTLTDGARCWPCRMPGVRVDGRRVLLIGAGGAARAVAYTLEKEGAEISIANRNLRRAHDLAASVGGMGFCLCDLEKLVGQADIIINATSVGMRAGDARLFDGRLLQGQPGRLRYRLQPGYRTAPGCSRRRISGHRRSDDARLPGGEGSGDLDREEGSGGS